MSGTEIKVKEILIKARALIEKPENWTQGALARSSQTSKVSIEPVSEYANCFCAEGALERAAEGDMHKRWEARRLLEKSISGVPILWLFNDNHTHAEVLNAFDRAIEKA